MINLCNNFHMTEALQEQSAKNKNSKTNKKPGLYVENTILFVSLCHDSIQYSYSSSLERKLERRAAPTVITGCLNNYDHNLYGHPVM